MHALDALIHALDIQPDLGSDGRVLFMRARAHPALEHFRGRLVCEQSWKPAADALEAAGIRVSRDVSGTFGLVLLLPERQRESILGDIAIAHERLAPGGVLLVALHNDWGAKTTERQLAQAAGNIGTISKFHSRAFWAVKDGTWNSALLDAWRQAGAMRRMFDGRFWTQPGIFHWDSIDEGSRLLMEYLPARLSGAVADLGCGWGCLSGHVLRHCPDVRSLDCYDADAVALECARRNLGLVPSPVRPRLHWHDVTTGVGQAKFDAVVMNPPFHDGRDADPLLGLKFITAAAQALRTGGQLWLVANKHLPYENLMAEAFEQPRTVVQERGFKVLHGTAPRAITRSPRRRR